MVHAGTAEKSHEKTQAAVRLAPSRFDRTGAIRYDVFAGWSSLVARRAHNPEVVGSNPTPATNAIIFRSQGLARYE
jgi:hypothetical protein